MTAPTYDVQAVRTYLTGLQKQIAQTLGAFDGTEFSIDSWQRGPEERLRGGGSTRILEGGQFFERGGIGFSDVAGDSLPPSASAARPQLARRRFETIAASPAFPPPNPHPPTRP